MAGVRLEGVKEGDGAWRKYPKKHPYEGIRGQSGASEDCGVSSWEGQGEG